MKIIAHRGASMEAPENTLLAFQRAIQLGADFAECDIRLTKDKVPIVIHDEKIDQALICELTFDEIEILTLEELLNLNFGKTGLMIEIKEVNSLLDINIICDVIKKCNSPPRFYIGSLEVDIVAYLQKLNRDLPLIGIAEFESQIEAFLLLQPEIMALHYPLLSPERITELHAKNVEVWGWTVDDPGFHIEGLDGVITNNVARFLQTRSLESGGR